MKMKAIVSLTLMVLFSSLLQAQVPYVQAIKKYQQAYVREHEVVTKKSDKKYFRFFPISSSYKVSASFTRIRDEVGFMMPTSGKGPKKFFRYGSIRFKLNGKTLQLTVYQNEQLMTDSVYKDHLFLPFTDSTSGEESYGGGRYIDLEIKDIKNNQVIIDFNKAYNPYCVYSKGYNCPIPPRENDLSVAIRAGEMDFAKQPVN
ncbi:MAG: DUF1684 domain-containing protein [Chitinophagaceae bacterium]|nr:MAG: DUF1684 domain-containing protein [Chitinophagaceae bacterium]